MPTSSRTADVVDFDEYPYVVRVSADADPSGAGTGWADPITSAEVLARQKVGFGGMIRLAQGRVLGPPSSPVTELLLGLLFWRSRSDAEAFAAELGRRRVNDGFVVDDGIYRFSASVTADPDDPTQVEPVRLRTGSAHEIITLAPVSGKQRWIAEYNESETRDHIRNLDGFVSTTIFRDLRSDRIIEYVQWRSADDLTAAFGDERFAEHMSVNSHYSDGEAFFFGERSTDAAPIDGPFGCTAADPAGHAIAPQDEA
ncbi:hypothetical protein ASG06_12350 [Rathayibacter sp. Leaf185]|nr:hypothetical protein ASF42_12350 [Rathayibacter sp. Leaf294]KQS11310.1 hypothetical protein ASG06_12350 [Rathayibacter sp. Leaf185]